MSSIAGIVTRAGGGIDPAMLGAMLAAAPAGRGTTWQDDHAALGWIGLRTTPEAQGEHQPLANPRMALCFDGRVDNRDELRAMLGSDAPPRDASDAAIVLAGWHALGERLFDRIAGDYALAIWEAAERRLTCARSPGGWRPLLWSDAGDRVVFATEPAMLMAGMPRRPAIDEGVIGEHLAARFATETDTFWRGVHRLPPGHLLVWDAHGVRTHRWFEGPFEDWSDRSEAEHVDRFNTLFDQALQASLRSSGPVVAQLSGGLDSSSIVCRSHQLAAAGRIAAMPGVVSTRFPGESCDEGQWIAAVEAQCGISTHSVTGAPYDWAAAASWSARTLHLPLRPNTLGTMVATCEWMQGQGASVLLTGEGGDDWFAGSYSHYSDLLRTGRVARLVREATGSTAGQSRWGGIRFALTAGIRPLVSARSQAQLVRPHLDFTPDPPAWIDPAWARRIGLADRWRGIAPPPALPLIAQRQRYGVYSLARRHMNIDNVLHFAASREVELRHPFHDLRLTRFAMAAAGGLLKRHGVRKHLLREAMRGTLPELIRERRDKANLSAPVYDAIATRLRERPIADLFPVRQGWVARPALEEMQAAHGQWRRDGAQGKPPAIPYGPLWNIVATDLWIEHVAKLA